MLPAGIPTCGIVQQSPSMASCSVGLWFALFTQSLLTLWAFIPCPRATITAFITSISLGSSSVAFTPWRNWKPWVLWPSKTWLWLQEPLAVANPFWNPQNWAASLQEALLPGFLMIAHVKNPDNFIGQWEVAQGLKSEMPQNCYGGMCWRRGGTSISETPFQKPNPPLSFWGLRKRIPCLFRTSAKETSGFSLLVLLQGLTGTYWPGCWSPCSICAWKKLWATFGCPAGQLTAEFWSKSREQKRFVDI